MELYEELSAAARGAQVQTDALNKPRARTARLHVCERPGRSGRATQENLDSQAGPRREIPEYSRRDGRSKKTGAQAHLSSEA